MLSYEMIKVVSEGNAALSDLTRSDSGVDLLHAQTCAAVPLHARHCGNFSSYNGAIRKDSSRVEGVKKEEAVLFRETMERTTGPRSTNWSVRRMLPLFLTPFGDRHVSFPLWQEI